MAAIVGDHRGRLRRALVGCARGCAGPCPDRPAVPRSDRPDMTLCHIWLEVMQDLLEEGAHGHLKTPLHPPPYSGICAEDQELRKSWKSRNLRGVTGAVKWQELASMGTTDTIKRREQDYKRHDSKEPSACPSPED